MFAFISSINALFIGGNLITFYVIWKLYKQENGLCFKIIFHIILSFQEKRGRHFLDDKRREPVASTSKKRKSRSPTPETEELKRLKRMKEIQDLVVKEEEKYVAEPLDPELFEWDNK